MAERRAPVNGSPHGTVAWSEHVEAWEAYHRHHSGQDAETIAARGGFGLLELTRQLGRLPATWRPSEATERWWRRFGPHRPTQLAQDPALTRRAGNDEPEEQR